MVNLPASAPVESKKPQEAHQAAMGLTAKSRSSKPLAPGSHAAAPSTPASTAQAPSAPSKSSSSTAGERLLLEHLHGDAMDNSQYGTTQNFKIRADEKKKRKALGIHRLLKKQLYLENSEMTHK